ncbi:CCA tRNA nucleotidyltransferase [Candidatus Nomurabacteria bacterium]|nr:CCA tRNA nucleotidyltransferase [Candidatus Nomurabacteria bacterium]MCB9820423.1 CCA tRNA nucleotidyltransferase [Candidatus Nomurabacteria bacterium]
MKQIDQNNIPIYIIDTIKTLKNKGFEAYIVGGCVRDLILKREPKDWDITTNATPEEIQSCFIKTVYENNFGTVAVVIENTEENKKYFSSDEDKNIIIEITPYRTEGVYSDGRHPDTVAFGNNLEEDLQRRDFTINAMAYDPINDILKDIYGGLNDIEKRVIKTVGEAKDRFSEDSLRVFRAIRFAVQLDFTVSHETIEGIMSTKEGLERVSKERIRDEFIKIVESPNPAFALGFMHKIDILKHISPEIEEGVGCKQGGAHKYDVFEHLIQALQHAADKNWPLDIRLSALFHDIGKPRTKRVPGKNIKPTFYGHEVVGAKMAKKILEDLKFSRETIDKVVKMVRYHMFFSDTEQISLSAVRRIVANVGPENIWDLMKVRECDRVGMAKAEAPYRLRKYHAMIEEVMRDPISVKQLKINGDYMIKELHVKPGRRMGWMLHALLEEVLDDPTKNDIEYLVNRVKDMENLTDTDLRTLGEAGKSKKDELEEAEVTELHKKHNVKK